MAYLSIYRKYRPKNFDGVVGQDHIVKVLTNQVKNDRISHAYLFTGTRGTGKTSVAKIFARLINCENSHSGVICDNCSACAALSQANNLDIIEMDAASNNGIDEIRDIRESVKYAPISCKYKVYIIDEAHMLTTSAWNALLKTLEEPPRHAVFILATTEAYKIPETILSRCMRFDFRLVPPTKIAERLRYIFGDMGIACDENALAAIAEAGDGSVRDAQSIADMCVAYSDGIITYESVLEVLGASSPSKIADVVEDIFSNDVVDALTIIDELANMGKSMQTLARDITKMLRNLYIIKACAGATTIVALPEQIEMRLVKTPNYDSVRLINMIELFSGLETNMRYTRLPRILLENAVAKASEITAGIDMGGLLTRIRALESGGNAPPCNSSVNKKTIARDEFSVDTAMAFVMQRLTEDNQLILLELHKELNEKNISFCDKRLVVGVDKEFTLSMFVKKSAMSVYQHIITEIYDIACVEFTLIRNTLDISNDIEYIKTIMGDCPINIIK